MKKLFWTKKKSNFSIRNVLFFIYLIIYKISRNCITIAGFEKKIIGIAAEVPATAITVTPADINLVYSLYSEEKLKQSPFSSK
jgi:hypothetical protein